MEGISDEVTFRSWEKACALGLPMEPTCTQEMEIMRMPLPRSLWRLFNVCKSPGPLLGATVGTEQIFAEFDPKFSQP